MHIGAPEVLLFVVVIVLFYGARKIPELARALGRSMGEFKKGKEESAKPNVTNLPKASTMDDPAKKSA